jgi:hypothetical protein
MTARQYGRCGAGHIEVSRCGLGACSHLVSFCPGCGRVPRRLRALAVAITQSGGSSQLASKNKFTVGQKYIRLCGICMGADRKVHMARLWHALAAALCWPAALALVPRGLGLARPGLRPRCLPAACRAAMATTDASGVRVLSLDVTGTLLVPRQPIAESYADAAVWARLPNAPSAEELKPAFKEAYYRHNMESPCFGAVEGVPARRWWERTVRSALEICGRQYSEQEFKRYFRRVFQHFGSQAGYEVLADVKPFLERVSPEFVIPRLAHEPHQM